MTDKMSDLIAYLRARYDEEEAIAQAANTDKARTPYGDPTIPAVQPEEWGAMVDGYLGGDVGQHCAYWTPLRVLADIAAKRAVLAEHVRDTDPTGEGVYCESCDRLDYPCQTLLALAQEYADRDDFDPAWRTR